MKNEMLDNEMFSPIPQMKELDSFKWWEKKRLQFNLIVGSVGVIMMVVYFRYVTQFDFLLVLIWGGIMNVAFFAGVICELFFKYYFKINVNSKVVYVMGLIFSVLVTFIFSLGYYLNKSSDF